MNSIDLNIVNNDVRLALEEDVGSGDVTADLIDQNKVINAKLIAREEFVLSGRLWFEQSFRYLDSTIEIFWYFEDGDRVEPNKPIVELRGNARHILTAERVALNFIQFMSAIATKTHSYKAQLNHPIDILDTRKTLPLLRYASKYAVTCGGGKNHRFGLFDAFLIKENHIKAFDSISEAINRARKLYANIPVEIEVESIDEFIEAQNANPDIIMLDNFSPSEIESAIKFKNNTIKIEVSGGINVHSVNQYDIPGVDFISIGDLTKSIQAIDFSFQVISE